MNVNQFIDTLFARANEAGFEACEVFYTAASEFETDVLRGEILRYSVSDSMGLGFRGLIGGRMGYASTQILDDDAVDQLVDGAKMNATLIENTDKQFLYPGDEDYPTVDAYNPALETITAAEKIEMARSLEQKALAEDKRITQVDGCVVFSESSETMIRNTLGLNVSAKTNALGGFVGVIARDGDQVNSGSSTFCVHTMNELDLDKVARLAVAEAVDGLNPKSAPSGMTRVLLSPDAAFSLLRTFSGVFSADSAQKGMSLLKDKEGKIVAGECVTLMDNPLLSGSPASRPFDGEGVKTEEKKIIDSGKLTTLLHNLKTAHKQGVKSTGNATRSYNSALSIAPSNFYFLPGESTPEALMERMENGLLITELQGMHAGANPISGDFSLSAKGFAVRNGKRAEAVAQITVAGNFYTLLGDIEAVGNNLKFSFPSLCRFGSPSLLIRELAIAGAE